MSSDPREQSGRANDAVDPIRLVPSQRSPLPPLPQPLTPFIGREETAAAVAALLLPPPPIPVQPVCGS